MSTSARIILTQADAQAELERQRAMQRAGRAKRKRRMQEDPEYAQQARIRSLQKQEISMAQRMRNDAQDRENMLEKVRQRYYLYNIFYLML